MSIMMTMAMTKMKTWAASSALLLPLRSRGWPVRPRRTAANTWCQRKITMAMKLWMMRIAMTMKLCDDEADQPP